MHGVLSRSGMMRPFIRAAALGGCSLLVSGCTALMQERGAAAEAGGAEMAVFSIVAARLASDAGAAALRVDPRPLGADPSIVEATRRLAAAAPDLVATPDTVLAAVPGGIVQARRRALEQARIAPGDVLAYAECPGGLGPPAPPPTARAGCPPTAWTVAAAGLSRPGGAYLPGSRVDERAQASLGYRSVRVIRRELRPSGATQAAYDFVLAPDPPNGWRIMKGVPLVVAE